MSVAKSLADVLARVATASTRAGRAAPVRARGAACLLAAAARIAQRCIGVRCAADMQARRVAAPRRLAWWR